VEKYLSREQDGEYRKLLLQGLKEEPTISHKFTRKCHVAITNNKKEHLLLKNRNSLRFMDLKFKIGSLTNKELNNMIKSSYYHYLEVEIQALLNESFEIQAYSPKDRKKYSKLSLNPIKLSKELKDELNGKMEIMDFKKSLEKNEYWQFPGGKFNVISKSHFDVVKKRIKGRIEHNLEC